MIKKKILEEKDCIIYEILDILSKKWNTFLLLEFSKYPNEALRFNFIKEKLNQISSRALSQRLKELEDWKIIKKKEIKKNKKIQTNYILTKKGLEILPILIELRDWAKTIKKCKLEKDCNKCDFIGSCKLKK